MMREQKFAVEQEPQVLLRPANGSKFALKEKFVQVYEAFFVGDDPSIDKPAFWDELFLLKVNTGFLAQCINVTNEEQLLALKDNLNKIFLNCLKYMKDESHIRARSAIETMCVIVRGICGKKFRNIGFDVVNLLTGVDQANQAFKDLVININEILLQSTYPVLLKRAVLRLLGVILTSVENINSNSIVEYLMIHDIFESLTHVVNDSTTILLAYDAAVILALLANYKKYEGRNPYLSQLTEAHDLTTLQAFASLFAVVFDDYFGYYDGRVLSSATTLSTPSDLFSFFTNFASTPNTKPSPTESLPCSLTAIMLCFYDFAHSNRTFMELVLQPGTVARRGLTLNQKQPEHVIITPIEEKLDPPLLSSLLSLLTVAAHDTHKSAETTQQVVLGLFALQCLTEDANFLSIAFDKQKTFSVLLVQKRVRKFALETGPRPFACQIYDALLLMIWASLRKQLPVDIINTAIGIAHRMVVYQQKNKIRLNYKWQLFFECLFALVDKMSQQLNSHHHLWSTCEATLHLINMIVIHGDDFINLAVNYDHLIYQILRSEPAFNLLKKIVASPSAAVTDATPQPNFAAITADLNQFLAIHAYFTQQLEASRLLSGGYIMTSEQVLLVIRNKLEGLTLESIDVDSYEKYHENPIRVNFFRVLLRLVVAEYKISTLIRPF